MNRNFVSEVSSNIPAPAQLKVTRKKVKASDAVVAGLHLASTLKDLQIRESTPMPDLEKFHEARTCSRWGLAH
jgi:hypothetical protein